MAIRLGIPVLFFPWDMKSELPQYNSSHETRQQDNQIQKKKITT